MRDLWECAWRELKRRKGRTLTNIFGYLLAAAIMVVVVGALLYSKEATSSILNRVGTRFIAFVPAHIPSCPECSAKSPDEESEGFVAYGVATNLITNITSFVDEVKKLDTVYDASGYLLFRFKDQKDGHLFTVGGFDPDDFVVSKTCCAAKDIVKGRFLLPNDRGLVILEKAYAKLKKLKEGDEVTIAGSMFSVIGIVKPPIRPAKADIYMHFDEAEQVINKRMGASSIHNEANVILVEVKSSKVQDEAITSMKNLLPGDYLVASSYACYRPAAKVMGINEDAAWLLTIIIGICAVILALKSQLSSVLERRRDIGILKAIGWTDGNVVSQILAESVLQAMIGGILGCLVAVAILLFVPIEMLSGIEAGAHIRISAWVLVLGFVLAFLGGIIAGSFPALIAARQQPADALRSI
jgi:putative ABC transport system permease protein